jgi:hypothetical protein
MKLKAYVLDVEYEKAFQSDIVLRGTEVLSKFDIKRPSVWINKTLDDPAGS